jgi:hypothetical protein
MLSMTYLSKNKSILAETLVLSIRYGENTCSSDVDLETRLSFCSASLTLGICCFLDSLSLRNFLSFHCLARVFLLYGKTKGSSDLEFSCMQYNRSRWFGSIRMHRAVVSRKSVIARPVMIDHILNPSTAPKIKGMHAYV